MGEVWQGLGGLERGRNVLQKVFRQQVSDFALGSKETKQRLRGVAPVEDRRLAAIFAFSKEPGHVGSVESTLKVYGRVMREHLEADGQKKQDGLND